MLGRGVGIGGETCIFIFWFDFFFLGFGVVF